MRTNEILSAIDNMGGFNNWRNWDRKEVAAWVKSNFNCSSYVANNVAFYLV